MSVEDDAERERLQLEDSLNDLIISLGLGESYEVVFDRMPEGRSAYLSAVFPRTDGEVLRYHPIYLVEYENGRVRWHEYHEGGLKLTLAQRTVVPTDLPDHIARWYALVECEYEAGEQP